MAFGDRHAASSEFYTPWNELTAAWLEDAHREAGSWGKLAASANIRLRTLIRIKQGKRLYITQLTVARLMHGSGVGTLADFPWFTWKEICALGISNPGLMFVRPYKRDESP